MYIDFKKNRSYNTHITKVNPFRYRGYYFDTETGLYYLNSRYYDPSVRRFINADDPSIPVLEQATDIGGLNLYSYCLNNPVNMVDHNGNSPEWWHWLLAGIGVALVIASIAVLTIGTGGLGLAGLGAAVAIGAAKGVLFGAAIGVVGGGVIGGATSNWSLEGIVEGAMIGFGVGAVIGAVVGGAVGGIRYQIFKPWGKIFNPNGPLFQEGVDPRSLKPIRNLNKLNPSNLARVEKYGRDKVIHVFKNGYISDGHHRVANAIRYKRLVDVFIKYGDYTP